MRFIFAFIVLAAFVAGPVMAQDLASEKGKLSYSVGWDIGEDIQRRGAEFDVETIIAAIRDSSAGKEPQVPAEEMVALLTALQQKVRQEQAEAFRKLAEENQQISESLGSLEQFSAREYFRALENYDIDSWAVIMELGGGCSSNILLKTNRGKKVIKRYHLSN